LIDAGTLSQGFKERLMIKGHGEIVTALNSGR